MIDRTEYMIQYRTKNKEKILAYHQAYEATHKSDRRLQKKIASKIYREKKMKEIKERNRTPKRRFQQSKYDAKKRGILFSLPFESWQAEVNKTCHYCRDLLGKRSETSVGLDRLDNNKGYIEGNVVSSCIICNKIKLDKFTEEETRVMVNALITFRHGGEIK